MRYLNLMLGGLAALSMLSGPMAWAAPTAEEAAQLGHTLTPFGAIKAGNEAGTIPEWTGGICAPPAGYAPIRGAQAGGGPYIDPFASEKPLFRISAADVGKYADKLDEGTKELLRRNPDSFHVDVYPTHRTACFPEWMYENTIKRVMNPEIVGGKVPSLSNAHAQIPFPIPKTGVEALWNANVKPEAVYTEILFDVTLVDTSGTSTLVSRQTIYNQNNYWDNSKTSLPEGQPYWELIQKSVAPASQVGVAQMRHYLLRPDLKDPPTWAYVPGQRRVRLAPEFSYDGVSTTSGGILLFDEINGFDGKMDRYDFKLVGRKEMYLPYNTYKYYMASPKEALGPRHHNPDLLRFELHRVWVVEATLKEGERHVQKRKVFYIDEDSWNVITYTGFDHADKVHHAMYLYSIQAYDKPEIRNTQYVLYDFNKGAYLDQNRMSSGPGVWRVAPYPANFFTPGSLAGSGVR